jgi:hypothetical protein
MKNKGVRSTVRCKPQATQDTGDILHFTDSQYNTGIILIIVYYSNSIENTVSIILYYCTFIALLVYSNMHTCV